MDFKIHPQLVAYMPSNVDEDSLRASIQATGGVFESHANPVILWRAACGNLYLLDGYTRWRICMALGLPFQPRFVIVDLPDVESALRWMRTHQDARRQLTAEQQVARDVLAGLEPISDKLYLTYDARKILAEDRAALERVFKDKKYTFRIALNDLKRRHGQPIRRAASPATRSAKPTPEVLDPIEEHRLKRALSEEKSRNESLLKQLAEREDGLALLKELYTRPLAPIEAHKKADDRQRKGVPVMLCSDWHVEETVRAETVNGLNEYNLDIAERCIERMAEAYEWMLRDPRYDCRTGVIWLGGDLISGYIHDELIENNSLSPVKACEWLQVRLEQMFRTIAANCQTLERIIVACNSGNHGRLTDKIRVSTREENSIENYLYTNLAKFLSDDSRFEFQIADGEWLYLDVMGHTIAFTHGDSFRYVGGVGGVSIPLRKGVNEIRKYRPVHHVSLGHFHTRQDFGDISINGSMIGVSPYSIRIHAPPEPRQQSWYLIDSERGKCLSAPIWL